MNFKAPIIDKTHVFHSVLKDFWIAELFDP